MSFKSIDYLNPYQYLNLPFKVENDDITYTYIYTIQKLIEWYKNYPLQHRIFYITDHLEKYIIQNNLFKTLKLMQNINYGISEYNLILENIKFKYDFQNKTLNQILMIIHDYLSIKMYNIEVRLTGDFANRQKNILINKKIPLNGVKYCYFEFSSQILAGSKINEENIYTLLRDNFKLSNWNDSSITYIIPEYNFNIIFNTCVVNSTPSNYITKKINTHSIRHKITNYTKEVEMNKFFLVYI